VVLVVVILVVVWSSTLVIDEVVGCVGIVVVSVRYERFWRFELIWLVDVVCLYLNCTR
jgi:hypothetical protein